MLTLSVMEKVYIATVLAKLAPLSMCGFIMALVERKKEEFPGYLGDNFPYFLEAER